MGRSTKKNKKLQEEGHKDKPAQVKSLRVETELEAPGTSVKESIQDIVVEGGQHVVQDVALTINQVIEPMEKGVTNIQETFQQHVSASKDDDEEEQDHEVRVEERVEEKLVVDSKEME